jgi:hypothetical protein
MNNYKEFIWPAFSNKIRNIFQEHILVHSKVVYENSVSMVQLNSNTNELLNLQNTFDFLSDNLLIFTQPPRSSSFIHVDNKPGVRGRQFAFNVGIKGMTLDNFTEFFQPKIKDEFIVTSGDKDPTMGTLIFSESDCDRIDEYHLMDNPILINTQVPHRVNNTKNSTIRISVSWTINPELSWEQVVEQIEYHRTHTRIN